MTDTLIVIGAGNNPEQHIQEGCERVILIEPHPRLAESLRQRAAGSVARVEELAVVTRAALNQLHEFNLPEVASVRQPTGLKHLLAGLRHKMSYPIATLPAEELCQRFELSEEGRHKLVVQANGEEVNIVLNLIESGDLARFQQVTLAARRAAYYDGEQTIDAVTEALQKLGFENQPVEQHDPDWPVWRFEANPLRRVVKQLRQELSEVCEISAQNEQLFHKHKSLAEDAKSQLSEQRAQHQELLASFEKLQVALNQEVEQSKLEKQRNAELTSDVQKLTARVNETVEQLKGKDQTIAELSKQLEERNYKVELMRQEVVKVQAQIELIKDVVVREKAF